MNPTRRPRPASPGLKISDLELPRIDSFISLADMFVAVLKASNKNVTRVCASAQTNSEID